MDKTEKAAESTKPGQSTSLSPEQRTLTLQQNLDLAVQHHTAGDLPMAEDIYQQILITDPNHPDALHLLGVIAHQGGENDRAVDLITKAIYLKPDFTEAHNNLGNVLRELGQLDEAMASYNKAITIKPDYAEAHSNLGLTLQELGRLEEAVVNCQKAIEINPGYAKAYNNLGIAVQELGRLDEAVTYYRNALNIKHDFAEAHSNLGLTLQELGQLDQAVASYNKAIEIKPDFAEAHYNLGLTLQELGRLDQAVASYNKALEMKPDFAEAHCYLGILFREQGRLDEAVGHYHKATQVKPDYAEAHNNLGNVFKELGRLDDAIAGCRKAIAIKPDFAEAGRNLLLVMLYVPGLSPEDLFAEHVRFSENHTRDIPRPAEELCNDPTPDRQLRIAYLSSDFRDHPVGRNILPLLPSHDRAKFEVYCYAEVQHPDAITERFRSCVDHWYTTVGKSDAEVARMVRDDKIDVLVCLAGRFDKNRPLVCAHRAAPVQVSYHDGPTSGLEEMDYLLTDTFLHPPDTKEMFTEELHRLPVFFQYPPIEDAPPLSAVPAEQVGFITFGSFNNPAKVNGEVIRLWAEVLKSVPGSRLLLKYKNFYDQASLRDSIVERFAAGMIGQDRIKFAVKLDTINEHLDHYGEVDIALDPFPFNGATTTFQALWMGVPVVSLTGERFTTRIAGSILHHTGLGELVVDTPEAYVTCARDLAGDLARLKTLRVTLRERITTSPLCDAPTYAGTVETAYRDMWRKWCTHPINTQ